ncbi:hypothetical protein HDF16_004838 [Granulicella aggregans]|uniref:Uncharacterized protein n=1 Tax=Granulicella aggregans TaxID=474949 RepID=A0A7W7ZHT5_9BACT|nr:hypothetical protein [Granulicella aggregans]MBB5060102.1 hypothetical protein [Granulicella aggregans]
MEAIDKQITRLQQARTLLSSATPDTPAVAATRKPSGKRRGRPKGSINKKSEATASTPAKKVRAIISGEGKARIAAAQKARWAVLKNSNNVAKPAAKKNFTIQSKKTVMPAKKVAAKRAPTVKDVATTKEM